MIIKPAKKWRGIFSQAPGNYSGIGSPVSPFANDKNRKDPIETT